MFELFVHILNFHICLPYILTIMGVCISTRQTSEKYINYNWKYSVFNYPKTNLSIKLSNNYITLFIYLHIVLLVLHRILGANKIVIIDISVWNYSSNSSSEGDTGYVLHNF